MTNLETVPLKFPSEQDVWLELSSGDATFVFPVKEIKSIETEIIKETTYPYRQTFRVVVNMSWKEKFFFNSQKVEDMQVKLAKILSVFGACRPVIKVEL
jgi:hypothetical protein